MSKYGYDLSQSTKYELAAIEFFKNESDECYRNLSNEKFLEYAELDIGDIRNKAGELENLHKNLRALIQSGIDIIIGVIMKEFLSGLKIIGEIAEIIAACFITGLGFIFGMIFVLSLLWC